MVSQEQKKRIGEGLMALGFVQVTISLPFIPWNLPALFFKSFDLTTVEILAITGSLGFLVFIIGYELWERNRTHWNDI